MKIVKTAQATVPRQKPSQDDFKGKTIQGQDFSDRVFRHNFTGFQNATFVDCNFDRVDFRGSDLSKACFKNCSFRHAQFGNGLIDRNKSQYVKFEDGCDLTGAEAAPSHANDIKLQKSLKGNKQTTGYWGERLGLAPGRLIGQERPPSIQELLYKQTGSPSLAWD